MTTSSDIRAALVRHLGQQKSATALDALTADLVSLTVSACLDVATAVERRYRPQADLNPLDALNIAASIRTT